MVLPDPSRRAKGHRLTPNLFSQGRQGRGERGQEGHLPFKCLEGAWSSAGMFLLPCPPPTQGVAEGDVWAETDHGFYTQKTDSEPQTNGHTCMRTFTDRESVLPISPPPWLSQKNKGINF